MRADSSQICWPALKPSSLDKCLSQQRNTSSLKSSWQFKRPPVTIMDPTLSAGCYSAPPSPFLLHTFHNSTSILQTARVRNADGACGAVAERSETANCINQVTRFQSDLVVPSTFKCLQPTQALTACERAAALWSECPAKRFPPLKPQSPTGCSMATL